MMTPALQNSFAKLKIDFPKDPYLAWQAFGKEHVENEEAFQQILQNPNLVNCNDLTFRAGRVLTPDEIVPEKDRIKLSKAIPEPDINFLLGNVGAGIRDSPAYTAFYRVRNLEMQLRIYSGDDNNCQFYLPNGDIITDNAHWLWDIARCTQNISNIPYLSKDVRRGVFTHTTKATEISLPIIPIIGRRNYYHFMIDHLPYIIIAQHIKALQDTISAFASIYPVQRELCSVFGAKMDSFVDLNHITGRKQLSAYTLRDAYIPAFIPLPIRLRVLRMVMHASNLPDGKLKIFLCRKPATGVASRLSNQEELEKVLSENGFQIVYAEDYSVAQQQALFSKAQIVVGVHGAGLTNMMFSPKRTLLIEIMNEQSDKSPMGFREGFHRICACNGQPYMRLVCPIDPDQGQAREQDLRMTCKPERILKLLEAATDALGLS